MSPTAREPGIDVYGPATGATGWATHTLGFARAADGLTPVALRTTTRGRLLGLCGPDRAMVWRGLRAAPARFGVVVLGRQAPGQPAARWVVWETTVLPPRVRAECESTPHLWTPSTWGRENLIANGVDPARVAVVPEGVDTEFYRPAPGGGARGVFRFLFVGKWEARKYVEGLVGAFQRAFGPQDPVELVLHAHNPQAPGFDPQARLREVATGPAPRIVCTPKMPRAALRALYQSADCFVCPTRAEGWGLPILESMACGVPAIVTAYSAPCDFVTPQNGFPLGVARMVDARDDRYGLDVGQWAEPDADHLVELLRQAAGDPGATRRKGVVARRDAERFSWRHAAEVALREVDRHAARRVQPTEPSPPESQR